MRLTTVEPARAVAAKSAETLAALIADALADRGEAHVALTGGSTAGGVYARLASLVPDWRDVHLWWGDERCVRPDDDHANYKIALRTMIEPADVPPANVHRIEGERGADAAARAYAEELARAAPDGSGMPVLDVINLGIGSDGHVASLFAGHPALAVEDSPTAPVHAAPKPPTERVTLTLPVLRAARSCVIQAVGADKADAIGRLTGDPDPAIPASLLPSDRLTVVVDPSAGAAVYYD